MHTRLTPELVLYGYQQGVFPMADPEDDDEIYWFRPQVRGVIPLETFRAPRNLVKLVRQERFDVASDLHFEAVIRACAERPSTWISEEIIEIYTTLHRWGYAHSIECRQEGVLVGGLYGIALGGAFFGESMFHRVNNASKVALVHLVRRLRAGGFMLLDTQYITPHLAQFGATEIPRTTYERRLARALRVDASWDPCKSDQTEAGAPRGVSAGPHSESIHKNIR
ncbi:MAG: leucyl/phenylalanyl-tRNA--protein transferase [Rhodothermales bacterium]